MPAKRRVLAIAAHSLNSAQSALPNDTPCNFMIATGITNPKDTPPIILWVPESHDGEDVWVPRLITALNEFAH